MSRPTAICVGAGCGKERPIKAKGLCGYCYNKSRGAGGRPPVVCADCGQEAPHFAHGKCRRCYENERQRADRARGCPDRRAARTARHRRWALRARFGLSPERHAEVLASQGRLCGICAEAPVDEQSAIDHCHVTGRVRGVLCRPCNLAIGGLRDNPAILRRAVAYLELDIDHRDLPR